MINFPLAHIQGKFQLEGSTYEIEQFKIKFSQPVDYKGQPQHEMQGGLLNMSFNQMADDNILLWGKTANLRKKGNVVLQTDLGITVLKIEFDNAYCIALSRKINALTGTSTKLLISAESVKMNEVEHCNFWPK